MFKIDEENDTSLYLVSAYNHQFMAKVYYCLFHFNTIIYGIFKYKMSFNEAKSLIEKLKKHDPTLITTVEKYK